MLLLPLVVIYELGLVAALRSRDGVLTNRAHSALLAFFDACGVRADSLGLPVLSLPAAALLAVLVTWQVLSRRSWSVSLPTVCVMAVESVAAALPLLAAARLLAWLPPLGLGADDAQIRSLGVAGQIAVAIGAGLYEELLFRMLLISLLHAFLADLLRINGRVATIASILISALLFAIYHPRDGGHLITPRLLFLLLAGLWWGVLFVVRGFGIAVGSHAAYDALALLLPATSTN